MSAHLQSNGNSEGAAKAQSTGVPLPERIAQLVNPRVQERRRLKIEQAIGDRSDEADRRRRYLETIVDNHLWKELKSA